MISTLTRTFHPKLARLSHIAHRRCGLALASTFAALWLLLAIGLTAGLVADATLEPARTVTAAYASPSESHPDAPGESTAVSVDPDDEDALLTVMATAALAGLVSWLTLPVLTGLSSRQPPLLQPPQ
jgi:hypothetical protein